MKTNRAYDALINADANELFTGMYALVDAVQKQKSGVQIGAVALLFRLVCERFDINVQDAFTAIGNMMSVAHHERRVQLAAARQYLKEELK